MIFRQIFDDESFTYTYLIAQQGAGEALIIDPVVNKVSQYLKLVDELDLKLVFAIDTHIHADHVTGLGDLREQTHCETVMGEQTQAECLSCKVRDGECLKVGDLELVALYTPGHTDDSYSFLLKDRVLTGDTLLIRGTGRTDFQNGNPGAQYDSLFNNILTLPEHTLVYPAHDYNGMKVSSIGEEKRHNPRLQVRSRDEYEDMMNRLNIPRPELIDVAVPANRACGKIQAS